MSTLGGKLHELAVSDLTNSYQKVKLVDAIKGCRIAKDATFRSYIGKIAGIQIILKDETVLVFSEKDYEPERFLRGEIQSFFLNVLVVDANDSIV